MERIYRLMDKIFDPPPNSTDKAGIVLHYQSEDEGYRRYKYLCYRNLILEALLSFCLGLFLIALLRLS